MQMCKYAYVQMCRYANAYPARRGKHGVNRLMCKGKDYKKPGHRKMARLILLLKINFSCPYTKYRRP